MSNPQPGQFQLADPDIFISYQRSNQDSAEQLFHALQSLNLKCWLDMEEMQSGYAWWNQITQAIKTCDMVIFLISPSSLDSVVCHGEIDYAFAHYKKILPVMVDDIRDPQTRGLAQVYADKLRNLDYPQKLREMDVQIDAPPYIKGIDNWKRIWALDTILYNDMVKNEQMQFDELIEKITATYNADLPYLQNLTQWMNAYQNWLDNGQKNNYLLKSGQVKQAHDWLQTARKNNKLITKIQNAQLPPPGPVAPFILKSETRQRFTRIRNGTFSLLAILFIIVGGVGTYWFYTQEQTSAKERESQRLANEAIAILDAPSGDVELAALLAIKSLNITYTEEGDTALVRALDRNLPVLNINVNDANIEKIEYSQYSSLLVTGSSDGLVQVWDADSGDLQHTFPEQFPGITHLQLANNYLIAVGTPQTENDNLAEIIIWDMDTLSLYSEVQGTLGILSEDGQYLAFTQDNLITIQEVDTRETLHTLEGTAVIADLAFSPDARFLVSGYILRFNRVISTSLWDVEDGTEITRTTRHQVYLGASEELIQVKFSPTGRTYVSFGRVEAEIWSGTTGIHIAELKGHSDWIVDLAYSPDGNQITSVSYDETGIMWDARTGIQSKVLRGHTDWVRAVRYSPQGNYLATASNDGNVRIWNPESGELVYNFGMPREFADINWFSVYDLEFQENDTHLVLANGNAIVWQLNTPRLLEGHTAGIKGVDISADGQFITTISEDETARIWDAESGQLLRIGNIGTGFVFFSQFDPDNEQILILNAYPLQVSVWNWQEDVLLHELFDHELVATDIAYSPDKTRVAISDSDGGVVVYDAASFKLIRTFQVDESGVWGISYSMDGDLLVTIGDDGVALWDAEDFTLERYLNSGGGFSGSLEFSADGKLLAVNVLHEVQIWDTKSWKQKYTLKPHSKSVTSVHFSPDSKYLVTTGDETATVWDTENWKMIRRLSGHTQLVNDAVFTPDSRYVITVSDDGTIRTWEVDQDFIEYACSHIFRDFSDLERNNFGIDGDDPTCP